jgi:hypothetical protein
VHEVDAAHRVRVRGERAHAARRADVPEKHGLVVGATGEHVALWREGEGVYVVRVADEGVQMRFSLSRVSS